MPASPSGHGEREGTELMPGARWQPDQDAPRCRRGATGGLERGRQSTQHGVAGGMLRRNVEATGSPGVPQRHERRQQVTIGHGLEGAVREHHVEHALDLDRVEPARRRDKSLDQVRCRPGRDLVDRGGGDSAGARSSSTAAAALLGVHPSFTSRLIVLRRASAASS